MALAKVFSCAVIGLDGELIEVEVDISGGQVGLFIVGLPDAAVQESKERVRSAIKNSGYLYPLRRIIVSLAPADLRKEGPPYATGEDRRSKLAGGREGWVFFDKWVTFAYCQGTLPQVAIIVSPATESRLH